MLYNILLQLSVSLPIVHIMYYPSIPIYILTGFFSSESSPTPAMALWKFYLGILDGLFMVLSEKKEALSKVLQNIYQYIIYLHPKWVK